MPARVVLEAASLALAAAITAWYWKTANRDRLLARTGWLWALWLLATPYARFSDEMLLAIPLLAMLRPQDRIRSTRLMAAVLYTTYLSVVVAAWQFGPVSLFPVPLTILAACMFLGSRPAVPSAVSDGDSSLPSDAAHNTSEGRGLKDRVPGGVHAGRYE
jgi:hypothetical protein